MQDQHVDYTLTLSARQYYHYLYWHSSCNDGVMDRGLTMLGGGQTPTKEQIPPGRAYKAWQEFQFLMARVSINMSSCS